MEVQYNFKTNSNDRSMDPPYWKDGFWLERDHN